MEALVTHIAQALVDDPASVSVRRVETREGPAIELHVAAADVGRVMGRQRRTLRSLRAIVGAAAAKRNERCSVEIAE